MTTAHQKKEQIENDAAALEEKFGEFASTYAENRAEAAKLRGADDAANHWLEVEEAVDDEDTDEAVE